MGLDFGGMLSSDFSQGVGGNVVGQWSGNYFAKKAGSKQRRWMRRMDNTKFQRAAEDLEAAGLNRVLALGNPGSTPSAGTPHGKGGDPIAAGIAAASAKQAIKQMKAKTALDQASKNLVLNQARSASAGRS